MESVNGAKLVIFDFDGTIANTKKCLCRLTEYTLERMGIDSVDKVTILDSIGLSTYERFLSYGLKIELAIQACNIFYSLHANDEYSEAEMVDGLKDFLAEGYLYPVIISNSPMRPIRKYLARNNLLDIFKDIRCNNNIEVMNKIDAYRRIARETKINRIWVFGDEIGDIVAGHYIGASTFLISNKRNGAYRVYADYSIRDYRDISRLRSSVPRYSFSVYANELNKLLKAINDKAVTEICEEVLMNLKSGGLILLAGNGGILSLLNHFSINLRKNLLGAGRVVNIRALGHDSCLASSLYNDGGWHRSLVREFKNHYEQGVLLLNVMSSAKPTNLIDLSNEANHLGAKVITICPEILLPGYKQLPPSIFEDMLIMILHYVIGYQKRELGLL